MTSAVIGANTLAQLEDSMRAAEIKPSPEDEQALDDLSAWT